MTPREEHEIGGWLIAAEEQTRADRQQIWSIWRRMATTAAVIERAASALKESRELLDRFAPPALPGIPGEIEISGEKT